MKSRKTGAAAFALLTALLCFATGLQARDWSASSSDHFEVYTEKGDPDKLIRSLERFRSTLLALGVLNTQAERKVHVFAFADRDEYFRYAPQGSVGFFTNYGDSDYIGLLSDDAEVVAHEYVHAAIATTWPSLPDWLQEGLAEFYSTATPAGHGSVKVGGFKWRYAGNFDRLSADMLGDLLSAQVSLIEADPAQTSQRYALSWAIVSMMRTEAPYAEKFDGFLSLLQNGSDVSQALESVYRGSIDQLSADLGTYLKRGKFASLEVCPAELGDAHFVHQSAGAAGSEAKGHLAALALFNSPTPSGPLPQ